MRREKKDNGENEDKDREGYVLPNFQIKEKREKNTKTKREKKRRSQRERQQKMEVEERASTSEYQDKYWHTKWKVLETRNNKKRWKNENSKSPPFLQ